MVGSGTGSGKFDRIREKGLDPTGSGSATLVYTLTPREHRTYSLGDSNNNIMAFNVLRKPCRAASLREGGREGSAGHAQIKS